MVLCQETDYVLLDEPLKGTDQSLKLRLAAYIRTFRQDRIILFTSHDEMLLKNLADEIKQF